MPAGTAVTGFTTSQVKTALTQVRKALIAARLDPKMLVNRDPKGLYALIAPAERSELQKDFSSNVFATYASWIAPGHRLAAAAPRVSGKTTFKAAKDDQANREIEIVTNYVWVYAFAQPAVFPGDNLVVVHDTVTWDVFNSKEVVAEDKGLWISESQSYGSNVDCAAFGSGLIAPGRPDQAGKPAGAGPSDGPDSMFDPNRSLNIGNTC
jgi:hypothetical protein